MDILKRIKGHNLIVFLFWAFACCVSLSFSPASAQQEDNQLNNAAKSISEAKDSAQLYKSFDDLQGRYFPEHKYAEFVKLLNSLAEKKKGVEKFIDYYIALSRYQQLKYLEEKQGWDEYFEKGNDYRNELNERALRVSAATLKSDPLNIYAKLILWQFHRDQEDVFTEQAFTDLFSSALEYAKGAKDLKPIKDVADKLAAYAEKGKAKELYRAYVEKLAASLNNASELKNAALAFYKEVNLELAEAVYDIYVEKIIQTLPKEEVIPILMNIATSFAAREEGPQDALYAEKVFKKIEELGGEDKFTQEQIYLRAFNLEKARDYRSAKDKYLYLLKRFPLTVNADEAMYKVGIIYTYVMSDIAGGSTYFTQLSQKEKITPQVISAIYQLGLLKQWANDLPSAKEYYKQLLVKAGDNFPETTALVRQRLKEIEETGPIEHNLKTFLDASLKENNPPLDSTKISLKTYPYRIYRVRKSDSANISSETEGLETGCLKPDIQYLWSGHLGTAKPSTDQPAFDTTYPQQGTKEINLVIVSSSGIVDRNIDMADVY